MALKWQMANSFMLELDEIYHAVSTGVRGLPDG